jgi:hypothetical protein
MYYIPLYPYVVGMDAQLEKLIFLSRGCTTCESCVEAFMYPFRVTVVVFLCKYSNLSSMWSACVRGAVCITLY